MKAKNLAFRNSIGREREKVGRRGKHKQAGRAIEIGGGSDAPAGGEGISVKATESNRPVRGITGLQVWQGRVYSGQLHGEAVQPERRRTADVGPTKCSLFPVTEDLGANFDVCDDGNV